jgi:lipase
MASRTSTSNTVAELHVTEWPGAGPTVLALAGLSGTGGMWSHLAGALPEARVVAPDLRGRGGSTRLPGPTGLRAHAADLVAVIAELGLSDVVVVGHSMGAFLAPVVAGAVPSAVSRLVLLDGGVPPKLPRLLNRESLVRRQFRRAGKKAAGPWKSVGAMAKAAYGPALAGHPEYVHEVAEWIAPEVTGGPGAYTPRGDRDRMVDDAVDSFFGGAPAEALEQLTLPIRLLAAAHGATDRKRPFLARSVLDEWTAKMPNLTAEVVEANHLTLLFSPEAADAVRG